MFKIKYIKSNYFDKKPIIFWLFISALILSINSHAAVVRVSSGGGLTYPSYFTDIISGQFGAPPHNMSQLLFMAPGYGTGFTYQFNYVSSNFYNVGEISPNDISPSDIIVVGDFLADGKILTANPSGVYRVMMDRLNDTYSSVFVRLDGDIDSDDKFLSGNFTGCSADEILQIKSNGKYHTMQYNRAPGVSINNGNFDILESGTTPMHWWNMSHDDHYLIGDFNSYGKDDLMAFNPNGWMHIMSFINGHWQFYSGGSSNGMIGSVNIDINNRYIVGDFDSDLKDELFIVNPDSGEAQLLKLVNGQWVTTENNNANGKIGIGSSAWTIDEDDKIFAGRFIHPSFIHSASNRTMLLIWNTTSSLYSIYYFE